MWDGSDVIWTYDGVADWYPLTSAQFPHFAAQFDEKNPLKGGVKVDVLIDASLATSGRQTTGVSKGGKLYQGRTAAQAPQIDSVTYVQSKKKLSPGELVQCVIVGSDGYDLVAKPLEELEKRVSLEILHRH